MMKSRLSTCARVILGDARVALTYQNLPEKANVLITDPPYCLLTRRGKNGDLRDSKRTARLRKLSDDAAVLKFENISQYENFTRSWLSAAIEHGLKPDCKNIIIWTNSLGKTPIRTVLKEFSYNLMGEYVWAKRSCGKGNADILGSSTKNEVLLRVFESALVFTKPSVGDEPVLKRDASIPWAVVSGYHDDDLGGGVGLGTAHEHPNHKPVAVIEPLILSFTKPNDVILDPFSGSGGTRNQSEYTK